MSMSASTPAAAPSLPAGSLETAPGPGLKLHELLTPMDPASPFFLYLLERQFPANEQVWCSEILRLLQKRSQGDEADNHLFVAYDPDRGPQGAGSTEGIEPVAMSWLEIYPDPNIEAAALWYLAVAPGAEGKFGYGTILMAELVNRAFKEGCRLMTIEVERADITASHVADVAERQQRLSQIEKRNRFYVNRFGAKHLTGVRYVQEISGKNPVEMALLILLDTKRPSLSPEEVLTRCQALFGEEALQSVGPIGLSSELPRH